MNILLLGATGYLGKNLADHLTKRGHHVIGAVRHQERSGFLNSLGVHLISCELDSIREEFEKTQVDWTVNCMCSYKPDHTLYQNLLTSNLILPLEILNLSLQYDVKNFMTMGTCLPAGTNVYSYSKDQFSRFGELICKMEHTNFIELRLEMFYGGMFEPRDRFIPSCCDKLMRNQTLSLTSGDQKRDLIHMEDLVEIISKVLENGTWSGYHVLPVGTGDQHSIREVVTFMKQELYSSSELCFGKVPNRIGGEPVTLADISWYVEIGYHMKYSYFEGLKKECREARGGYNWISCLLLVLPVAEHINEKRRASFSFERVMRGSRAK